MAFLFLPSLLLFFLSLHILAFSFCPLLLSICFLPLPLVFELCFCLFPGNPLFIGPLLVVQPSFVAHCPSASWSAFVVPFFGQWGCIRGQVFCFSSSCRLSRLSSCLLSGFPLSNSLSNPLPNQSSQSQSSHEDWTHEGWSQSQDPHPQSLSPQEDIPLTRGIYARYPLSKRKRRWGSFFGFFFSRVSHPAVLSVAVLTPGSGQGQGPKGKADPAF